MDALRDNIFSLLVKFDSTSQTLTDKSLDNILLRIVYDLYVHNTCKPISEKQIKANLDLMLGGDIHIDRINNALIRQKKRISPCGNKRYTLSEQAQKELNDAIHMSCDAHKHVIQTYFSGATTSEDLLESWIKSVLSEFFVSHFAEYTQNLKFGQSTEEYQQDIDEIITQSFDSIKITDEEKPYLRRGFKLFFEDRNDSLNNLLFWNYGVTCFAAKMANASLFADKYTIQELQDTTFVLDTNILFTLNLENTFTEETIKRLEETLKKLNISLLYISPTKDEYKRVADTNYGFIKSYIYNLRELPAPTQISDAALKYGCYDENSLDAFFASHVNSIPQLFYQSLKISEDDSQELDELLKDKQAIQDVDRKYRILLQNRKYPKNENAVIHDVKLLSYVYYKRKAKTKYTILTNDYSIQAYANAYPIRDEGATAICLEALIAILCINNAGIGNGEEYQSLFKRLININFRPIDNNDIVKADLYRLNDILVKIEEINPIKGEELQRNVLKLRSQNAPFEQIHLELIRELKLQERNQSKELNDYKSINADQKRRIEEIEPALSYIKDGIRATRVRLRWLVRILEICLIVGGVIGIVFTYKDTIEWTCSALLKIVGYTLTSIGGIILAILKLEDKIDRLSLEDVEVEKAALKKISHINK